VKLWACSSQICEELSLKAVRVLHILTDVLDECRFIYAFLGSGIITCFVALIGHIAAETSHGFCLSCVSCLGCPAAVFFELVLCRDCVTELYFKQAGM